MLTIKFTCLIVDVRVSHHAPRVPGKQRLRCQYLYSSVFVLVNASKLSSKLSTWLTIGEGGECEGDEVVLSDEAAGLPDAPRERER